MTHEAAIEIDVIEHPKSGKRYISVDAIVNLMESIAHPMDPGPGKNGLLKIADSLRPISSYSHADPSPSTPKIKARRCECKAVVVDLLRMSGKPITVDVDPVPDGQWIVIDGQNGRTVVAPWNNTLEGNHVRLSEHTCTEADSAFLPQPDYAHTPEAKQRRLTKAEQLADFMVEHRIQHAPDATARRHIAQSCGLSPTTSDETWSMALQIWQERR